METRNDAQFLRNSDQDHINAFKFRADMGGAIIEGQEISAVVRYIKSLENAIMVGVGATKITVHTYPANLSIDTNEAYWVQFPDVPEANAVGDTVEEALDNAIDALESALSIYADTDQKFPVPSKRQFDQHMVTCTLLELADPQED